jgi:hypothetical protein
LVENRILSEHILKASLISFLHKNIGFFKEIYFLKFIFLGKFSTFFENNIISVEVAKVLWY